MVVRNTVAALFSVFHQAESAVQTVALLTPVQHHDVFLNMFSVSMMSIISMMSTMFLQLDHLSTRSSHLRPVQVSGQEQEKSPRRSMQCPSFRHGASAHSSTWTKVERSRTRKVRPLVRRSPPPSPGCRCRRTLDQGRRHTLHHWRTSPLPRLD